MSQVTQVHTEAHLRSLALHSLLQWRPMAGLMEVPCCPRCSGRMAAGSQVFGVRSYLHLFYEECAFTKPEEDEEEEDHAGVEMKQAAVTRETWSWLLWMVRGEE
ncbi:neurensin-1-like [Arapaima gigas]